MAYGFAGSISPKAGKKLKAGLADAKLAILRQTRAQKSKMATFEHKERDEGKLAQRAEVPNNEINNKTNQGGSAMHGRHVSKGGPVGKSESQFNSKQIDQHENKKAWPKGGDVSASNPKTGNTRMKGTIAPSGPIYGGGGRNTQ